MSRHAMHSTPATADTEDPACDWDWTIDPQVPRGGSCKRRPASYGDWRSYSATLVPPDVCTCFSVQPRADINPSR